MRFTILMLIFGMVSSRAATNFLADGSWATVSNAVALASSVPPGDTIIIPAETNIWESYVGLFKPIRIQGSTNPVTGAHTVIRDSTPGSGGFEGNLFIINNKDVANSIVWIDSIWFENFDKTLGTFGYKGTILFGGSNTNGTSARVSNCGFYYLFSFSIVVNSGVGVSDHNVYINVPGNLMNYVSHEFYDGGQFGDKSWSAGPDVGGTNFYFMENNRMRFDTTFVTQISALSDAFRGARFIARFNTSTNGYWEAHGTDTTADWRGTRHVEIYGNTNHNTVLGGIYGNIRSGSAYFISNKVSGVSATVNASQLQCDRMIANFAVWRYANGTNDWDLNTGGGPFESGTATGFAALQLEDSTQAWTPGQWTGYSLQNLSSNTSSEITGNTATQITYRDNGSFNNVSPTMQFAVGNMYQIWRVHQALDMTGTGTSDLLSRSPLTPHWLNGVIEPCYEIGNTNNGTQDMQFGSSHFVIVNGTNYFNNTLPPGWAPAPYPHPLITLLGPGGPFDGDTNPPPVLAPFNLKVQGRTTISGRVTLQ